MNVGCRDSRGRGCPFVARSPFCVGSFTLALDLSWTARVGSEQARSTSLANPVEDVGADLG